MVEFRAVTLSTLAAALLAASPANSAGPSAFVTHLMGRAPGPGKTFACFARTYDDAHLAAHPAQNLRSMQVLAVAYANMGYSYQLRMGFAFRGRPELLSSVAECGPADKAEPSLHPSAVCAGPIAGGSMSVSLEGDRWLLLNIPNGAHLWKPGPPKPDDTVNDAFGADDKLIRLRRTALSACEDQALDDAEKALLRKGY